MGSVAAVEAELAEAKEALASGCKYFIGGHGGLAEKKQVEFKIAYLETVQRLLAENADADGFLAALNAAYPVSTATTRSRIKQVLSILSPSPKTSIISFHN